ncbi:Oidioi.mRNA.OKI2018_I69.PAR.g12794.t1.cds [Oikopleura dioica]|uniref:Oidioi.mRNA.OKI2018_I69.PAR.g12794.t1.cds n=1 Tax=Oikopleura dioica TaxID=34765 RepID=A0ABN7S292_OIKDI|nr:Oidioi.mRNA.OKI2018_I69.PAR.g12794.t1.cds [Oikopleura dioica]
MTSRVVFDNNIDAFDEAQNDDKCPQKEMVHIRIQQRNGRKTLTTVQGLSDEYDLKKIIKVCKRHFACNGTVVDHAEWGEVIQFQGDQRANIQRFLLGVKLARAEQIKVHGF